MSLALSIVMAPISLYSQVVQENPDDLKNIDVEEHLGDTIPLELEFTADNGEMVRLEKYFQREKPVILILGYYTCPMLCNLIMNGLTDALRDFPWLPGREFQIVSVSIDPTETEVVAAAKKKNYINSLGKPGVENGWDFLTGPEENSRKLAESVGFKYFYIEDRDEYAHPAVLIILTEKGEISRYLYGIQFKKQDLKLALTEASEGKVGSTLDRLILYCYHYDPKAGGYVVFAGNIMRLGGLLTLLILAGLLVRLWLREHRKKTLNINKA
jgi:protein SCO1/2